MRRKPSSDLNQRASDVVAQATGQAPKPKEKDPEAVARGRLGGLKRAERTSEKERKADARAAVEARWARSKGSKRRAASA